MLSQGRKREGGIGKTEMDRQTDRDTVVLNNKDLDPKISISQTNTCDRGDHKYIHLDKGGEQRKLG